MHLQEIPSIVCNVFEFVCMFLYRDYLSDLHKKFQIASTHDASVEYQIWIFCRSLFLKYAHNRHANTHSETETLTLKN